MPEVERRAATGRALGPQHSAGTWKSFVPIGCGAPRPARNRCELAEIPRLEISIPGRRSGGGQQWISDVLQFIFRNIIDSAAQDTSTSWRSQVSRIHDAQRTRLSLCTTHFDLWRQRHWEWLTAIANS